LVRIELEDSAEEGVCGWKEEEEEEVLPAEDGQDECCCLNCRQEESN
jgi:hypothetical protein